MSLANMGLNDHFRVKNYIMSEDQVLTIVSVAMLVCFLPSTSMIHNLDGQVLDLGVNIRLHQSLVYLGFLLFGNFFMGMQHFELC